MFNVSMIIFTTHIIRNKYKDVLFPPKRIEEFLKMYK